MLFKSNTPLYSYEIAREAGTQVIYINYLGAPYVPNLAEDGEVMARTIDVLVEAPNISRIVFIQQRNYSYGSNETFMLQEIANIYVYLTRQEKILAPSKLSIMNTEYLAERHRDVGNLLIELKRNPLGCFIELERIIKKEKNNLENTPENLKIDQVNYIKLLERFQSLLKNTKLVRDAENYFSSYVSGKRDIYYHFFAPEYSLNEEKQGLLNLARNVLIEHQPKAKEFTDPEKVRQVFLNVSRDLLRDLSESKNIQLDYNELNKLASILVRHTIGFGLIEILLQDKNLQDIVLNAPISANPVFLRHSQYDECITNIIPSKEDADSWAAKFRMISGRPLDEANPVLDTDLSLGNIRARIAVVQEPLSPSGLAYAIRRHREEPWTLPLFVKNKMINSLAAGLFSFLIDGSRTLLVAGTRSSGKTSMLGALMLEIMPKYRIIVLEDSVCGDSKMIINKNGNFEKTTIGKLIDKEIDDNGFLDSDGREKSLNSNNIKIFSVDNKGKIIFATPSKFIRHKTSKSIYEVMTTSGKKIKVTEDHPLFTIDEKNIFKPIKSKNIKEGGFIAIPSKLVFDNKIEGINLLDNLEKLDKQTFIFLPEVVITS